MFRKSTGVFIKNVKDPRGLNSSSTFSPIVNALHPWATLCQWTCISPSTLLLLEVRLEVAGKLDQNSYPAKRELLHPIVGGVHDAGISKCCTCGSLGHV